MYFKYGTILVSRAMMRSGSVVSCKTGVEAHLTLNDKLLYSWMRSEYLDRQKSCVDYDDPILVIAKGLCTSESTVIRGLGRLRSAGLIKVSQAKGIRGRANSYVVEDIDDSEMFILK